MVSQNIKNFNLGKLQKTTVTASSGLLLLMTFAKDIGLIEELERTLAHLKKRRRGYAVSEKVMSFVQMLIKGGDRLSDIDVLRSDPGLLDILMMERFPRPATIGDLARKFSRRDIHGLAEVVMKLASRMIRAGGKKEVVLDIDSSLVASEVAIAEKTYEGYRGFNPLLGILKGGRMSMAAFSVFRLGNAAPQSHNLSLLRKISSSLRKHNPGVKLLVRIDSAGYNHRVMGYCERWGHEFVIAGDEYECILEIIKGIEEKDWEALEGGREGEEVAEGVHFVGPERTGAAYRFVVVRRRKEQLALFPEFGYSYRIYFTNTAWAKSEVVHFYRDRGDAENVIKEEKEGYAVENILSEDFLANAALFQMQVLAYNLVQYFKYTQLKRSWWVLRIKQLRYRLINIAGVVVNHARKAILRLSVQYKYFETFRQIYHLLCVRRVELRI
jgi:hypothetical protein